ncbi:hypothetical protein [Streptomyces sp. TLI_171]|uniref:hypothetical protein n=1 Tax=Streptomyces sp. TLI_171 TaxID=1938859 RepID=UPI000C1A559F|nr:hypothetical protein [Streptomyces sp. TLI_171]RKE17271.1 hypothetical protein BX266_0527 [Streptomyces sp. TLI_171]
MTAIDDAPDRTHDPHPARPADPWQHLLDGVDRTRQTLRRDLAAVTASYDAHLARLDTLRHTLAHTPDG